MSVYVTGFGKTLHMGYYYVLAISIVTCTVIATEDVCKVWMHSYAWFPSYGRFYHAFMAIIGQRKSRSKSLLSGLVNKSIIFPHLRNVGGAIHV